MKPFTVHTGIVAPLDSANVDTDQIIPKQFLKLIEKTGFGKFLFFDWRFKGENTLNPDFEMNAPRYQGASILIARDNFGCGSSREHAPWAIDDYGFRAILAPSFADIFHNNCFNNGLLPIQLDAAVIQRLFDETRATPGYQLTIDLDKETITTPSGETIAFKIDPFKRHCLLGGLDQIGLTLQHEAKISEYEKRRGIA